MNIQKQMVDSWAYDISKNVLSKGEIRDVDVINQSIESIIGTLFGERIFNLSFGSDLTLRIFDIQTKKSGEQVLNSITDAIKKCLPKPMIY